MSSGKHLVSYASSSASEDGAEAEPTRKKVRTTSSATSGVAHAHPTRLPTTTTQQLPPPLPPLPPPPPSFANLYATAVRSSTVDDPALHGGLQRHVPHAAGRWPSHVYVEWMPGHDARAVLERVIATSVARRSSTGVRSGTEPEPPSTATTADEDAPVHSFLFTSLAAPSPLHISLSTTLQLSGTDRDPFLHEIQTAVRASGLAPFTVYAKDVRWVSNRPGNRRFLVLRLQSLNGEVPVQLGRLVAECNALAERMGMDELYARTMKTESTLKRASKTRSTEHDEKGSTRHEQLRRTDEGDIIHNLATRCHVSIAWSLNRTPGTDDDERGNDETRANGPDISDPTPSTAPTSIDAAPLPLDAGLQRALREIPIPVQSIKVKLGNRIVDVWLEGVRSPRRDR